MRVAGDDIRRVAADDADGEVFEAWERVTAEPDIRGVYASKTPDTVWTWRVEIAVLEFVRAEPLVSEVNSRLEAALAAVPGVTAVTGEDRDVLIVAGVPAGRALMIAATTVIDALSDDLRATTTASKAKCVHSCVADGPTSRAPPTNPPDRTRIEGSLLPAHSDMTVNRGSPNDPGQSKRAQDRA
jgi:hypothetical protein